MKTGIRENSIFPMSDATKVLKVSQFSKSLHDCTDFDTQKSDKMKATFSLSKAERHQKQFEPSQKSLKSPQILRVVDIVPNIDQTIGIPVKSPSHFRSCPNSLSQTLTDFQDRLYDIRNEPQVIHHPLVSGNIPNVHESHKKIMIPDSKTLLYPIQKSSSKRENGEKNKVKFCNTVSVCSKLDVE